MLATKKCLLRTSASTVNTQNSSNHCSQCEHLNISNHCLHCRHNCAQKYNRLPSELMSLVVDWQLPKASVHHENEALLW